MPGGKGRIRCSQSASKVVVKFSASLVGLENNFGGDEVIVTKISLILPARKPAIGYLGSC
ncbi:hypothetical protein [[Phormidium] sp. ETS-05]|uniref:hypothetical protein n=1 Tax=[Phormidium] sp. ETS-05 TaxID=222819 RepID=UPI0018EF2AD8|nr:hypothetical protein [[Phormidium] sp. ETS-05]